MHPQDARVGNVQVDVWAKNPADCNDISIAVIGRLHCFQGTGVRGMLPGGSGERATQQ